MTTAVAEHYEPIIGQTFVHIRQKMVEIQKEVHKEEERTKEIKMEIKEEHVRERMAVDKQRGMRDRMQEIDTHIDKIQGRIQYVKEREFVATRRYEENVKMCETLRRNQINGMPSYEEKMVEKLDSASEIIKDIGNVNKKLEAKKKKLLDVERRELKARNRIEHFEEMLRTAKQVERRVAINYQPKSAEEYKEEINDLVERLSHATKQIRLKESRQRELEKKEGELQARVDQMKRKCLDIQQTKNELKGSRL